MSPNQFDRTRFDAELAKLDELLKDCGMGLGDVAVAQTVETQPKTPADYSFAELEQRRLARVAGPLIAAPLLERVG